MSSRTTPKPFSFFYQQAYWKGLEMSKNLKIKKDKMKKIYIDQRNFLKNGIN